MIQDQPRRARWKLKMADQDDHRQLLGRGEAGNSDDHVADEQNTADE